mmetsp:Transcript_15197/g.45841  ORF Transcript_15197/g.45841 Transcript_15197/m.45841 type:complete len:95 (+) Transcript_15197:76-360(+)
MGGTSNPSEEQLALVTARVIEIAAAISETAASLDGSGYFEDSGFDDEERGAALSARLLEYCGSVEELDPNIDIFEEVACHASRLRCSGRRKCRI